jgi:dienelactone hydrolase
MPLGALRLKRSLAEIRRRLHRNACSKLAAVRASFRLSSILILPALVSAQGLLERVRPALEEPAVKQDIAAEEIRRYIRDRITPLPASPTANGWAREARRIRERVLREVVYKGWPKEWVDAPLRVEDRGLIPTGPGYRLRKLRYEIVPGMWGAALLYEPEKPAAKAPAILNVNGHVGPPGKSVEYKQKRCIQQARMGAYALNLEWLSYGELSHAENSHYNGAHLDLAGANGLGIFYLAMRKGLDILYEHPGVDRARIGVTGLSGGGWQTIILSALDERVAAAAPVAGYSATISKLERTSDLGDHEQSATDLMAGQDYSHFTAMLAPRPAHLIYNTEDNCCFRGPLVRPHIFDAVIPFYRASGKEDEFGWHENFDPGDHNYQLENRMVAYRFFARAFGLKAPEREDALGGEVKTEPELRVGLPEDNLTIAGLARRLAGAPKGGTAKDLANVLRFKPARLKHAWALGNARNRGLESESLRFEFENGLSAAGVWMRAYDGLARGAKLPATILIHDGGKKGAAAAAADRLGRGEQALALDPVLYGDMTPDPPRWFLYARLFFSFGERPLGIQAAQVLALAGWLRESRGAPSVRLQTDGKRSQLLGLAAGALSETGMETASVNGIKSFSELLTPAADFRLYPELFTIELFKYFDINELSNINRRRFEVNQP